MSKPDKFSLVEGGIINKLFLVAFPLIITQIFQMAYNLTDMFWLGRLSSDSVAASGTVGMFVWLSMAFMFIGRMGAEIGVSQSFGRKDRDSALVYARNSIQIGIVLGVALAVIFILCRRQLIGFFNIREAHVEMYAMDYLELVSVGFPFAFTISAISGVFNGSGNSRVSLLINGFGAALNMILDPIMIFTADMGIRGAGIATIIAQASAACLAVIVFKRYKGRPFEHIKIFRSPDRQIIKQIFRWVTPISIESFLFTFLTMLIAALIASYGAEAMAAQRVSTQIESMTWLIAGGYASALTAFTGQNFGAGKWRRIRRGFIVSTGMMAGWGAIVGLILYFGCYTLIGVFIPNDPVVVEIGVGYMQILALIQIPSCLEGVAAGVFRGLGKTVPPSLASVSSNSLRVVFAYLLTSYTTLGLTGIWIAIAAGAALRGSWIFIWYVIYSRRNPKADTVLENSGDLIKA